jgi:hypothetical protein
MSSSAPAASPAVQSVYPVTRLQQFIKMLLRKHGGESITTGDGQGVTLPKSKDLSLGIWVIVKGQIPVDLMPGLLRDFNEDEIACIFCNVHKSIAPPQQQPAALFIFGPPAVGKSSTAHVRVNEIFGSSNHTVLVDGSELRDVHGGFQAVSLHGKKHCILHADAWSKFKTTKASARLKQRIFSESVAARQHLVIPDCGNDVAKVEEMIDACTAAGYQLHAMAM